ncbi:MAG: phage tail protein I [Paracoccus sp. (in: a-proteobacteria)]
MTDLLPANATRLERAVSLAGDRARLIETPSDRMWDPERMPVELLPWLAWALSVDDWDPAWSEDRKRELIAGSIALHRIKGTRRSVETALEMQGYGTARIVEDRDLPRLGDDDVALGGDWELGPDDPEWADYWVEIMTPVARRDADHLAERLASVAPARCRLRGISLTGVFYTLGDDLWLIGDDVAIGNTYLYETPNG